jgi:hypothetical protein
MVEVTQEDANLAQMLYSAVRGYGVKFGEPLKHSASIAVARHRIATEQRARIEGFNGGIEAAAQAMIAYGPSDEIGNFDGATTIRALAKPMKGPTDEA